MKNKLAFRSRKQRSPLYWALLELATLADEWFEAKPAGALPGGGRIMFALRRALIAFTHASAGRDTPRQLERVRAALEECEPIIEILHRRVPEIVEEALRRIEQIVSTLDRLDGIEVSAWANVELAPFTNEDSAESWVNRDLAELRKIAEHVALIASKLGLDSGSDSGANGAQAPPSVAERPIVNGL